MKTNATIAIQIAFKGVDSSDPVKAYAEKRAQKLVKSLHTMINCHFVFSEEKKDFIAQLHVTSGEFDARAEGRGDTFFVAIDEVTDKLVHQAVKFKEKQKNHSGKPHHGQ